MAVPGFQSLDFREFHLHELPERLARAEGAVARVARAHGSLAFRLPGGDAYTYALDGEYLRVEPGDDRADTVIELAHDAWEGLVHDYESAPGLLYAGRLKCVRGQTMKFVAWEPGLRSIFRGVPIYDVDRVDLRDQRGNPLDVEKSFSLVGDPEEMAHFLRTAGYLFVRDVFRDDEVKRLLAEAAELRSEAVKGDKLSWWGKNAAGDEILCRVTRAAAKPALRSLSGDPRLLKFVELADEKLVQRRRETPEQGVTVIFKNPQMTEGLSDIPWHRDCGMGGHSVMCPVLLASVYLTPANPETGELKMLPGSWQSSCGYLDANDPKAPRGASFSARPGDVSLHYGDSMHVAPPPTRSDLDAYRISAVTAWERPDAFNHRGANDYNDVLHRRDDGQIEHLTRVAADSDPDASVG